MARSAYPLWDEGVIGADDEHRLNTVARFGLLSTRRETLGTSVLDAVPQQRVVLPGQTIIPLFTALAVAFTFIGVIYDVLFVPFGILLVFVCLVLWHWPKPEDWDMDYAKAGPPGALPTSTDYTIPGGNVDRGRQAMTEYGCIACHTIPGVTRANATVGPPLTAWADRSAIAGQFPNTPEYLIQWLQDPQAMIPGSIMPDVGVPEVVARDMSAYLYTLERNALGLPWW